MGAAESRCSELLLRLGWERPAYIGEFYNSSLAGYLEYNKDRLEVILPTHAPKADITSPDRKPHMYPRPNFCWEGNKMHLALIGPSTACKNHFETFLPKIADVFQGPSSRLGPGREAKPYYFLDEELHKLVVWELPELTFKQHCEDYIRELGLLYVDCVFLLFSDKYLLTDLYCKLCVAMAIHGIPFFVVCTMSDGKVDDKSWQKLKSDFQKKDIQVRMFNPHQPQESVEELISEMVKIISWSRSREDKDLVKHIGEDVLGQTVRLKNIEKKPELNGRCGVCIGFDNEQARYRVRLINSGVETDIAIKQDCLSVLKPKLLQRLVRISGLESKPELNGRFGFVDEFLRENERYRVFVPDVPGKALVVALKPANLERADSLMEARPIPRMPEKEKPPKASVPKPAAPPSASPAATRKPPAAAKQPEAAAAATKASKQSGAASFDPPAREKPVQHSGDAAPKSRPDNSQQQFAASKATSSVFSQMSWVDDKEAKSSVFSPKISRVDGKEDDDIESLLPKLGGKEEEPTDLMSRILIAEAQADDLSGTFARAAEAQADDPIGIFTRAAEAQADDPSDTFARAAEAQAGDPSGTFARAPEATELQFACAGLLALRVWAVMGCSEETEDIVDHLMDCEKNVYTIGDGPGANFETLAKLCEVPDINPQVLLFVEGGGDAVEAALNDAVRLGILGIVMHPSIEAFRPEILQRCRSSGLVVHGADVFEAASADSGIAITPLD